MTLRRVAPAVGLALAAGMTAEVVGLRAFSRLVESDIQAHLAGGGLGVVTEQMLGDLPAPAQRYLRRNGIVGRPLARRAYLPQEGRERVRTNHGHESAPPSTGTCWTRASTPSTSGPAPRGSTARSNAPSASTSKSSTVSWTARS